MKKFTRTSEEILASIEANIAAVETGLQQRQEKKVKTVLPDQFDPGDTVLYCRYNQIIDTKIVKVTDTHYVTSRGLVFRKSDLREAKSRVGKVTLMYKEAYIIGKKNTDASS